MPRTLKIILSLSVLLGACVFSRYTAFSAVDEESAKIVVGATKIFSTREPTRVIIGNPNVADVDVSKDEIIVSGKAAGMTTLTYWDMYGEQSVKIKVLAEDTDENKARIDALLKSVDVPEVYTQTAEDEAKVLLLGRVKTKEDKDRIATALGPLKDKTTDLIQIKEEETVLSIDVQILELDRDGTQQLGFTWPTSVNLMEVGSPALGAAGTTWPNLFKISNIARVTPDGTASQPFQVNLDLLMKEGKARILSRPRLSCQSGKQAKLVVGGEVPILSANVSSGGTAGTTGAAEPGSVQYKEYGIILEITPKVTDDGRVHLNLNVEVSDIQEAVTTSYALAYPLLKRTATTELFLDDGQTMGIGGLIKQKTEQDLQKFPWLGDVPVLGAFFRHRTTKEGGGTGKAGDTELFITLTPTIVARDVPKKRPGEKEEAFKKPLTPDETFAQSKIPANLLNYAKAVQIKILNSIFYPAQAKDAGWQGTTVIGLNITVDGSLQEAKVLKSSGYKILDDAALDVAIKKAPYPPFPPQIESEEVSVEVPVVYKKE